MAKNRGGKVNKVADLCFEAEYVRFRDLAWNRSTWRLSWRSSAGSSAL